MILLCNIDYNETIAQNKLFYDEFQRITILAGQSGIPKFIIDIEYEKIINNPEKQIRNLIEKCDLKWNPNCLKFYENKRPIKTASDIQARKKIYKTSINSWKNYEKHLRDFFCKLPH